MAKEKEKETGLDITIDILKWLYYENKDILQRESEILQNDITPEFETYLEDKVKSGETINICIRGEVSGSKSTSGISIKHDINNNIERLKLNKNIDEFRTIFADQTEFLRFVNNDERNVCILIDEFSRVAETGLNASTESVMFDYYSDVFAQKFIHRVSCAPSTILDKNATVILDYIGKDEENKISKFKLSYRNPIDGFRTVTLGHILINVGNVLDEKFYLKYRKKKFDRMNLLDKHGVRDIRELEFANIILKVIDELQDMVVDGSKVTLDTILATTSRVCREEKRIYSILVTSEISSRARNILNSYSEIGRCNIKISKAKTEIEEQALIKKKKKYIEMLTKDLEEENKRSEIYKEYLQI